MGNVVVEGVGKAYRQYHSKWGRLLEWVCPFFGERHKKNWVLRDISFSVAAGEALALVGFNGAGKSTLLKIIAGTLRPTEGRVSVNGRVSALLELGMGFHEEFTGRQNVFMAGQLMGYSIADIEQLMPSIEEFAEIGNYIDMPLRTYSSGMQVRLAFSVATATRPELLIVDEALSVGDSYFQHKSFDRIRKFREQGTTLLIVTHDRHAVETLCDRAVLIDHGSIATQGAALDVLDHYHALMGKRDDSPIEQFRLEDGGVKTVSGSREAVVREVFMRRADGKVTDTFCVGEQVELVVRVAINQPIKCLVLGMLLKNKFGQPIYGINTHRKEMALERVTPDESPEFRFSFPMNIGPGNYSVSLSLSRGDSHVEKNYEWTDRAMTYHVVNSDKEDFYGACWLNAEVQVERCEASGVKEQIC